MRRLALTAAAVILGVFCGGAAAAVAPAAIDVAAAPLATADPTDTECVLLGAANADDPEWVAACDKLATENGNAIQEEQAAAEEAAAQEGDGCGITDLVNISPAAGAAKCVQELVTGGVDLPGGPGAGSPLGFVDEITDKFDALIETMKSLNPKTIVETWAKEINIAAVGMVEQISAMAAKVGMPAFDDSSWAAQYAITSALGLLIFASLLAVVAGRLARQTRDRVEQVELMRDAGLSVWLVPVMIFAAPAALVVVSQLFGELAGVFVNQKDQSAADDNMVALMNSITNGYSDLSFSFLGGPVIAIVFFGIVCILGLIVVIQVLLASQAATVLGLLLPVALAMWIYPPWRSVARGMISALLGLLLLSPMLQIVFWGVWGNVASGASAGTSAFESLLRLVTGLVLLAGTPALCAWILPKLVPNGTPSGAPGMGGGGGGGAMSSMAVNRLIHKQSSGGGGGGPRSFAPAPRMAATGGGGRPGGGLPAATTAKAGTGAASKASAAKGAVAGPAGVTAAAALMGAQAVKQKSQQGLTNATSLSDSAAGGNHTRKGDR